MSNIQFWSESIEKQIGHRVQIVLGDAQLRSVYEEFGAEALRRSSVYHGLDQFMRDTKTRGRVAFEVGTWNALTSVILSRYFDEVVTLDLAVYSNPLKHRILQYLGIKNVRCIDIKDNAEKARIAGRLEFDFAYMDGNHADDTLTDWEVCKPAGRVLFHECWPFQEPVFNLVHSLPQGQVCHNGMGLALWDGSK